MFKIIDFKRLSLINTLILTILAIFIVSCGTSTTSRVITSYSNDVSSFVIPSGTQVQVHVYAKYSDGSKQDITNSLIWSSSDSNVTVVNGLITAPSIELNVSISYETVEKLNDGSTAYSNILKYEIKKLALKTITLSSSSLSLSVGATTTLTALGVYEDNKSRPISNQNLNWSSSDSNITKVIDGVVTGVGEGEANVTASDGNISSLPTYVIVKKVNFSSISIYAPKTRFNVEQSIELEVRGMSDKNETIIVDNSLLLWSSSDSSISVKDGLATAITKGNATINVQLKEDTNIKSSISLVVEKDKYLRVFKDNVEVDFSYISTQELSEIPTTLSTYIVHAVGTDFRVGNLKITKLDGLTSVANGNIYFDGLVNKMILDVDTNVTFELKHDGSQSELFYFFDINDTFNSSFSVKYNKTI